MDLKKNPIEIPSKYNIVSSFNQAEFHFNKGSVLSMPITWFTSLYIHKCSDNVYEVMVIPLVGRTLAYEGDRKAAEMLLKEYDFFVCKGKLTQKAKPGMLDRMFAWVQEKCSKDSDNNGN